MRNLYLSLVTHPIESKILKELSPAQLSLGQFQGGPGLRATCRGTASLANKQGVNDVTLHTHSFFPQKICLPTMCQTLFRTLGTQQ